MKEEKQHKMSATYTKRFPEYVKWLLLLLFTLSMFVVAMTFGAANVSIHDVYTAIFTQETSKNIAIIREIRLPRELAALVVGAALAVAGAIMQGMTCNPLADPGLFGLSAGASAALALTLALYAQANYFILMLVSFIGAGLGGLLVFTIASAKRGKIAPLQLVLAGAAVSAFLFAIAEGTGLYFKVTRQMTSWTAGGMVGTTWGQLRIVIPVIFIGILCAILLSRQLTILSLDEAVATGLGQKTALVKICLFVVITLLVGASVALAGNITFVGLLIPHIARRIAGSDYRVLIPMSVLIGGGFMLLADTIGRTIHAPFETSVPAIVAIIGLPFFLMIVRKGVV